MVILHHNKRCYRFILVICRWCRLKQMCDTCADLFTQVTHHTRHINVLTQHTCLMSCQPTHDTLYMTDMLVSHNTPAKCPANLQDTLYIPERDPIDIQFAHIWCTRTKIHLLQACPMCGVDPLNLRVGVCIHSLKLCTVHKPEKVGTFSMSSLLQLRTTHAQIHNK